MLRYYVLTTRKFNCLRRQFHSLPKEHTTVVINTLDKEYEKTASQWCWDNKINCVITESNGYPGKGKNAVLDHFLDSDYEYMVQIDGDDFMQPHGVALYKWLSENDPPDGVQIVYSHSYAGNSTDPWNELFAPFPWDQNYMAWVEEQIEEDPSRKTHLMSMYHRRDEYRTHYLIHRQQNCKWNYPPDSLNYMDCARLIFYSRHLAESVRFREDLLVGEDSLLNYQVRDMAFKGDIVLRKVLDTREKTYTYDLTNSGIVKKTQWDVDWEWMELLNAAVDEAAQNWTVDDTFVLTPVVSGIDRIPYINLGTLPETKEIC